MRTTISNTATTTPAPTRRRPRRGEPFPAEPGAPMLATPGELPARPDDYSFEYKWDGVRAICQHDGRRMRLLFERQSEYLVDGLDQIDSQRIADFFGYLGQILFVVFRQNNRINTKPVRGQ